MIKDVKLNDFPRCSGVYWFTDVNGVIIYVGSSKDLYKRMIQHRTYIKAGSSHGSQKDFYEFLQKNQFTVHFEITECYRQDEQDLIEKYSPTFNQVAAHTGIDTSDRKAYKKAYYEAFKEEMNAYQKAYHETHKEEIKAYHKAYHEAHKEERKQRNNQKCVYNGETLTLSALKQRFRKQGIPHPQIEAKKYIIDIKGVEK